MRQVKTLNDARRPGDDGVDEMTKKRGQPYVSRVLLYVTSAFAFAAALTVALCREEHLEVVITPQHLSSVPYHDGIGLVETFSSEADIPFRFVGKTIGESPFLRRFVPSVEKFANILSCLKGEARVLHKPSLGDFDWDQIDSDEDAQVCLFRLATSYATIDDLENWMESQGLRVNRRIVGYIDAANAPETIVNANWPIKEKGPLYRSNMLQGWLNSLTAYGESLSVTYRQGLGVYSTDAGYTRE